MWSPVRALSTLPISFLNHDAWAKHSSPGATSLLQPLLKVTWSLYAQVMLAFWPSHHVQSSLSSSPFFADLFRVTNT